MNAVEFLNLPRLLDQKIRCKEDQIMYYESMATRITSLLDANRVSSPNRNASRMDLVIDIVSAQEELRRMVVDLIAARDLIVDTIREVRDPGPAGVLEMRFVCFLSFDEIAARMNHKIRWVYARQNEGLAALQGILDRKPESFFDRLRDLILDFEDLLKGEEAESC